MFSKNFSESYIQNMLIFREFFKTQSDQIYTKTHQTASYFQFFFW